MEYALCGHHFDNPTCTCDRQRARSEHNAFFSAVQGFFISSDFAVTSNHPSTVSPLFQVELLDLLDDVNVTPTLPLDSAVSVLGLGIFLSNP